jgi:hypothetical protein
MMKARKEWPVSEGYVAEHACRKTPITPVDLNNHSHVRPWRDNYWLPVVSA